MKLAFEILFWISLTLIVHSYVFYPIILQLIATFKKSKIGAQQFEDEELPTVSILMAAFNEEAVLRQKVDTIFNTVYPRGKIELWVGSDNSSDKTNEILKELANENPNIHIELFTKRQGKISIINQLYEKAKGSILIVTDANVLFEESTILNLMLPFKDEQIGLVDTSMHNYGLKSDGISFQEKSYISREVKIKNYESQNWGTMIGPFGGCYAVRKNLFTKIPSNYLVDDFFVCMKVLEQGKKAINRLDARVFEDVSNDLQIEFKRKERIAMGNFQNLKQFRKLLWPITKPLAFCFFSHKVLRWLGPFLLIAAFVANLVLALGSDFYRALFVLQVCITILPFIDFFLKKIRIHILLLRFATHFYTMNLSLLTGFIKYLKGINTNVWKPTKRFQE